jgi:hypothetical protein
MYAVISTNELGEVTEVEFFSERPRTPYAGMLRGQDQTPAENGFFGDRDQFYAVFEGNIDGGDSILIETHDGKIA